MPSLDVVTAQLWATPKPALCLLATAGCARAAAAALTPEERAPFEALSAATLAWWPLKKRTARDILEKEYAACLDVFGAATESARLEPALEAAQHEMEAMRFLAPGTLTYHEVGTKEPLDGASLTQLVRRLAKLTKTDLELWKGRFEYFLSFTDLSGPDAAWPELVAKTARIGFDRPMRGLKELSKPLQELAKSSDLGAVASWSTMGPKHALTLQLGKTKRTAMLDDEQRAALIAALPWLV